MYDTFLEIKYNSNLFLFLLFYYYQNDSLGLLQYACRGDSIKIVSTLISKGCKIAFTPGVPSPLHFAAETGNVEILKKVLDTGIYIDPVSKFDDTTPLTIAVKNGNYDSVKLLLENGANANHVSAVSIKIIIFYLFYFLLITVCLFFKYVSFKLLYTFQNFLFTIHFFLIFVINLFHT